MKHGLQFIAALAVVVDARWVRLARVAARQAWLEQVSVSPWSHCVMKRGCYAFGGRGGCHGGSPFLTGDGWAGGVGGGAGFCSGMSRIPHWLNGALM